MADAQTYTGPVPTWSSDAAGEAFCYLTTIGRRSGRPHTVEMWFGLCEDRLYVLAGGRERADWVRNLLAQSAVSVRIGQTTRQGTARVLEPDTEEDRLARRLLVKKYDSPAEPLDDWGRTALPVVVTFGE